MSWLVQSLLDWLRSLFFKVRARRRLSGDAFHAASAGGDGALADWAQCSRQDVARERHCGASSAAAYPTEPVAGGPAARAAESVGAVFVLSIVGFNPGTDGRLQRGHDSHRRLQHAQGDQGQRVYQGACRPLTCELWVAASLFAMV